MRIAKVFEEVQAVWKSCSSTGRKVIRSSAMGSRDADFRLRCKIILNLIRGQPAQKIHEVLGCSLSQVYRIARRFVEEGDNVTRNHRCRTMNELMKEVCAYLQTRQQALRHEYAKQCAA